MESGQLTHQSLQAFYDTDTVPADIELLQFHQTFQTLQLRDSVVLKSRDNYIITQTIFSTQLHFNSHYIHNHKTLLHYIAVFSK